MRAVGYFVMRHRAFADRVLILGTGPLARKLIEEIEARPHFRYRIVGVADDGQRRHRRADSSTPCSGRSSASTRSSSEVKADRDDRRP